MKKILAILFSVFYFGFSSGAVFSVHYCMNELASISQKVDDVCSKCGVKTKKDCCKTEIKIVKVDDSQKSDFLKIDFLKQIYDIRKNDFFFVDHSFSATKFTQIQINAPPQNRSVPSLSHIVILEFKICQSFDLLIFTNDTACRFTRSIYQVFL